ncbi:MAG TPA: M57 family metalloprotease [Thermoanaerobaculia bacterium]|nr:M57 family metalloprotease [Thermoanaerobaculia bacterium]
MFLVPEDKTMILEADGIVMGFVTHQEGATEANRDVVTVTHVAAEDVLKGDVPVQGTIAVRDLGGVHRGRAMGVSGGVQYQPGERVLLFLDQKADGSWTTYGMVLGKMKSMRTARGEKVLLRDMGAAVGLSADGRSAHQERARTEEAFMAYIRRTIRRDAMERGGDLRRPQRQSAEPVTVWPGQKANEPPPQRDDAPPVIDYFQEAPATSGFQTDSTLTPVTNSHYPPSAYTQGTFRWATFDAGQSVTYYSSGTQPGYDAVGAAQRALAAWTNDPNSNVNLVYGGTRTNAFVEDGVNAIVFNSTGDVPAGAIGFAKWYANDQHTYKGQNFYSISEGDTVIKANISVSAAVFQEAVTHEVGHTLGFRHSDQGTPTSTDAVMRSSVTGRYGTTLGSWDIEAVTHVYGSTATTPVCTPPAITRQPTSAAVTRGGSVTLSVAATGTAPLSYQWYIGTSGNTASPILNSNSASYTVTPTNTTSYWVRVTNACGVVDSATATITVNEPVVSTRTTTRGDFNFDGRSDLLWRNKSTGANRVWYMDNTTILGTAALPTLADTNWRLGGAGEFNGDGKQDLMWHNTANGTNTVWLMNGTALASTASLPVTGSVWYVGSVMDYDRNGGADIVWRHRLQPYTYLWLMSGTTLSSSTAFREAAAAWELIGTGDFNSDLWQDLVFRNVSTSQIYIWFMVATNLQSSYPLPNADAATWAAGAIIDANRDGYPDLVWRNKQTGANFIWYTRGGQVINTAPLPSDGDLNWEIAGPR